MTNLQKRVLVAFIYMPLVLLSAHDSVFFSLLMSFFLGVAWHEYLCFRARPETRNEWVRHGLQILVGSAPTLFTVFGWSLELGLAFEVLFFLGLVIMSLTKQGTLSRLIEDVSFMGLGLFYLTGLFSLLVAVQLKCGPQPIWFIFLVVGISDSAAYFCGKSMGRTPFFQNISPKKTQEGFMAGVAAGAVSGALICGILKYYEHAVPGVWAALALGVVVASLSAFGDLFESMLKRHYKVKDSGGFFPGHGGVMDRLDAVLFAVAPVFFFVVMRGGFR